MVTLAVAIVLAGNPDGGGAFRGPGSNAADASPAEGGRLARS